MNKMNDVEEFEICTDIASRTALFALAMACNDEQIDMFYAGLTHCLEGVYSPDRVSEIVWQYRQAAKDLKRGMAVV